MSAWCGAASAPDHRGEQHAGDERDAGDGERVALDIRAGTPQAFLGRLGILIAELPRLLGRSLRRLAYFALRALRALGDRIDRFVSFRCEVIGRARLFLFVVAVTCRHRRSSKFFHRGYRGLHVFLTRAQLIEPVAQWIPRPQSSTSRSASSFCLPYSSCRRPTSCSRWPEMRSQSLSEILPQRCCALPFSCFHCPLMTSQFMARSPFLGDAWGLSRNQLRRSISSFASSTASSTSSPASSNTPSSQAARSVTGTPAARTRAPANRSQRTGNFAAFMEPPVVLQTQAQPCWACRALTTQLSNRVVGARSSKCKVRASSPSGALGPAPTARTQIF